MNQMKQKLQKKARRAHRVHTRIIGTSARPRLTVFRSNQHLYAQLIDDTAGHTLCAVSDIAWAKGGATPQKRVDLPHELGKRIAFEARAKNITAVVFDRGAYRYHGKVKQLAEGAREGGLQF